MRTKDHTVEMELHPILMGFLFAVDNLYRHKGGELTITSGSEPDPVHGYTSLHYAIPGCAADLRNWGLVEWNTKDQHDDVKALANSYCEQHPLLQPGDIDVVLEKDHCHVELQPKRRG